jgi:hypothetical protein
MNVGSATFGSEICSAVKSGIFRGTEKLASPWPWANHFVGLLIFYAVKPRERDEVDVVQADIRRFESSQGGTRTDHPDKMTYGTCGQPAATVGDSN